ncbi:MAG: hypothetical protein PHI22_01995 [Bacilli bacterium]|nr:hypothetical protein [Bacilli bacterium]MDD4643712.1 hypothetical protein [Bacilli bacterium]
MDKIREVINGVLDDINGVLDDNIFVRAPKIIKLRDIERYLTTKGFTKVSGDYLNYHWKSTAECSEFELLFNISKERTICDIKVISILNKFIVKWLYELWVCGTEIDIYG